MHIKNKRLIILISVIAALLVIGGFFIVRARPHKSNTASTQAPDQNASDGAGLPRQSESTPSNNSATSSNGSGSSTATVSTAPAKPTLNKSSGNAGPIPDRAVVNFVCTSAVGTSCDIILTSKTDSSNVIKLGVKQVASSYGQTPFASWDWTSVSGDWTVVARASSNGGSTDSDPQGLKVQ